MLNDILKNAGVESADTYHERLKRCTTNQCRTIILQQAEAAEERAGKIVLDLYKSGRLSDGQVDLFITSYANKMMMGASDSERQNRGNQDVYTQNGLKWTPVGLNSNPHINELITRSLLKRWSRENVPVETIANRLEQNQAVSNWFNSVNIDTQAALISQVTGLGSQAVILLITKGRNGKVLSTAERVKIENVVQQGGGNTLATRERVNSNIQETRRGNQSSQFGTHAQQERKLEQPITANGQANAVSYSGLKLDLKTTQAANEVVESLRKTGKLPTHYITKINAEMHGWQSGKALNNYVIGAQIGGDVFKNNQKIVPEKLGRTWYEADIGVVNTQSRSKQSGTRLIY